MNSFLIIVLLLVSANSSYEIQTYEIPKSEYDGKNPIDLAHGISEAQPEILRKIIIHYLTEEINILQRANSKERTNQIVLGWFNADGIELLRQKVGKFMRDRLFEKLDMKMLSLSFRNEIEKQPQTYFLTYDMYDLLID